MAISASGLSRSPGAGRILVFLPISAESHKPASWELLVADRTPVFRIIPIDFRTVLTHLSGRDIEDERHVFERLNARAAQWIMLRYPAGRAGTLRLQGSCTTHGDTTALQNRVTPFGDIIATPERGLTMGNRGILHDEYRRLGRRRWTHKAWICCVTAFRGRKRQVMTPGRYTELFFLDEAVAFAAGHRPCFECRREAARVFANCWGGNPRAGEMDRVLHAERLDGNRQRTHADNLAGLPDGAFVSRDASAWLVKGRLLLRYTPAGYDVAVARSVGAVEVLTPPAVLRVLRAGYAPLLHPSAEDPFAP